MVFRNQKRLPTIGAAHLEGSRQPSKAESAALQHRRPQLSSTERAQRLRTGNSFMEFPSLMQSHPFTNFLFSRYWGGWTGQKNFSQRTKLGKFQSKDQTRKMEQWPRNLELGPPLTLEKKGADPPESWTQWNLDH